MTDASPTGSIEFVQFRKNDLPDGLYELTLTQTVSASEGGRERIPATSFSTSRSFTVLGERFCLAPQAVLSVFPPEGSLGEHSNVLPHVVLSKPTLPWERRADFAAPDCPWLALLLFDEAEAPELVSTTLGELQDVDAYPASFSVLTLELGQHSGDRVNVIDVPAALLADILPSLSDLSLLAHVRQSDDDAEHERAVVLANRLPAQGGVSVCHLVSVESRFSGGSFPAEGEGDVRLISLKHWRFACEDERQRFKHLLEDLDRSPPCLRLPTSADPEAEVHFALGQVPLRHEMRRGDQSVSWYRGPLLPGLDATESDASGVVLPARSADALTRYDPALGMFDASYSAAWELGRLLLLRRKDLALSLFRYKRSLVQQRHKSQQHESEGGPLRSRLGQPPSFPTELSAWFEQLAELRHLPFSYLVPDERLLPPESIRFFRLDPLWLRCLFDGASSVGRVSSAGVEQDQIDAQLPQPGVWSSGFLLRSELVSGWPDLLIEGYVERHDDLAFVPPGQARAQRLRKLSPNVLLCLFDAVVRTVDIHQKPESMHFGLDSAEGPERWIKVLRNDRGVEQELIIDPVAVNGSRVVDISGLAESMGPGMSSASFALEMIEGVQKVRFVGA